MLYVYIALILTCETTAISCLKEYAESSKWWYFLLGVLFYAFVSLFLVRSFAFEGMGIVNAIWSAFSVVFVAGVGALKFHERITKHEVCGMILAISGIIILRMQG